MKLQVSRRQAYTSAISPNGLAYALLFTAAGMFIAVLVARLSPLTSAAVIAALVLGVTFVASPWAALLTVLLLRASTDLSYAVLAGDPRGLIPALPNIILIIALIGAGSLPILRIRGLARLPALQLLFLLVALGAVGILRAPEKVYALSEWLPLLGVLVIYVLAASLPNHVRDIQRVILVITLSAIPPAVMGVHQLVSGSGLFIPDEQITRIYGTFVHPNALGIYLVLLFGLFLARFACTRVRRPMDFAFLGATLLLLVGTYMRGAWVGVAVIVAVVGVLRNRWLLFAFPLLAVILMATVPSVGARAADPLGSGSFTDRLDLWAGTYAVWYTQTTKGVPLFVAITNWVGGLGPGAASPLTEQARGSAFAAHNDYLRVLVEYGVLGVVLYLAMILSLVRFGLASYGRVRGQPMDFIPLALLAVTLAYAVMSLTDNVFGSTQNQVYFWALAGISVAASRLLTSDIRSIERAGE